MTTFGSGWSVAVDSLVAAAFEGDDEEEVGRSWLAAARSWTDSVRARVTGPARQAGQSPSPVMVLSANGTWVEQLTTKVRPSVLEVLRRSYRRVTGAAPPPGFDQSAYVTNYLNASVNRMTNTPDEVYREISASIAEGTAAGETVPQLAARVDHILTVNNNPTWTNRGVVVARTEVTGAQNAGTLAAAGERQAREKTPLVKTWLATTHGTSASRTRPAHRAADGQTVPITEPFTVGEERLQYPGDPNGSAGNVIQCRCSMTVSEA